MATLESGLLTITLVAAENSSHSTFAPMGSVVVTPMTYRRLNNDGNDASGALVDAAIPGGRVAPYRITFNQRVQTLLALSDLNCTPDARTGVVTCSRRHRGFTAEMIVQAQSTFDTIKQTTLDTMKLCSGDSLTGTFPAPCGSQ